MGTPLATMRRALLLLALCAPDSWAGTPRRVPRSDPPIQVADELQEFLDEHDRIFCTGRIQELRPFYAPDFVSPDLSVPDREEMLRVWESLWNQHSDVSLKTCVFRVEQTGPFYAISACRPFQGTVRKSGQPVVDDLCETMLIERVGPSFEIVQLLEMDHDKLGSFLDASYCSKYLCFEISWPKGWIPVPHRTPGSCLEKLAFLEPSSGARIDFAVLDPSLPLDLFDALSKDLREDARCGFVVPPAAFALPQFQAVQGEVECRVEDFGPALTEDHRLSAIYASPDGRMLFALSSKAPARAIASTRAALEHLARSLTLQLPDETLSYCDNLFALHSGWCTVDQGFYEHPKAPLAFEVPPGLRAVPLAGSVLQRVRFELEDDPSTAILLQVFEPFFEIGGKRLDAMAERLVATVCSGSDRLMSDTTEPAEFLGWKAVQRTLEFYCGGKVLKHHLISVERDGYHVQLILIAGSEHVEVHQERFEQLLTAMAWS